MLHIKEKGYILCHQINTEVNFFLTNTSFLDDCPIEKWLDIPRAHDEDGNLRNNYFAFALKKLEDKDKFKVGDVVDLWDNQVEVIDSFKLSDGRIIAFLKCYPGKFNLVDQVILADDSNKRWNVRQYLIVFGSPEGQEKILKQESENIFQYLLSGIGHLDKPVKGSSLRALKNSS